MLYSMYMCINKEISLFPMVALKESLCDLIRSFRVYGPYQPAARLVPYDNIVAQLHIHVHVHAQHLHVHVHVYMYSMHMYNDDVWHN